MRILKEDFLIRSGEFAELKEFSDIINEIQNAIKTVTWNSPDKFVINPKRKGNGVVPIKNNFIEDLKRYNWQGEVRMTLAKGMNPGPIDVIKDTSYGRFAVEWETGNISSSHRAMNKIAVGIIQKQIIGGILILPVKSFAKYLTDRIGNYEEFAPYFCMYEKLQIAEGVIGIIGIEHDKEDENVPLIKKGKDGNAKK